MVALLVTSDILKLPAQFLRIDGDPLLLTIFLYVRRFFIRAINQLMATHAAPLMAKRGRIAITLIARNQGIQSRIDQGMHNAGALLSGSQIRLAYTAQFAPEFIAGDFVELLCQTSIELHVAMLNHMLMDPCAICRIRVLL